MKEKLKSMSQAFVKNALGLDGIINALTRNIAPTPPEPPIPPGPDTLPEFAKYGIISRDPHYIDEYDEHGTLINEIECSTDKCLIGFDANGNATILKKTGGCGFFDFVTTLPAEMDTYWDAYYSYEEDYERPEITFYTVDSEGIDSGGTPLPYGFKVDTQYETCEYVWGDSNFPYVTMEIVTREQAETFFNS